MLAADLLEYGPQVDAIVLSGEGAQVSAALLIDTGADVTMMAGTVLEHIGADWVGTTEVSGVTGREMRDVYGLTLYVMLTDGHQFKANDIYVVSMPDAGDGVGGLIGRDILQFLRLHYDGPEAMFSLTT